MGTLIQDLRFGFRMLAKNPGFTAVAVLTLALGIGATSAIFSAVYGVLLRPLPYPQPDQIVELREVSAQGQPMNFADPNFEDLRSQSRALAAAAEYGAWVESVSGGSEPRRTMVASVSRDFFSVMGVEPIAGRAFAAQDQHVGAAPVALLSYGYWKQYSVARRTHEIGVRMVLGAHAGDVLRLVLRQGLLTVAAGVAVGTGGSFVLTRAIQSLLFGVGANDPVTFAGVALLLTLVALLATYVPARRASRLDPVAALRHE